MLDENFYTMYNLCTVCVYTFFVMLVAIATVDYACRSLYHIVPKINICHWSMLPDLGVVQATKSF